ncbi:MAG: hypothetical protein HOI53_06020 [Francisellaceae bacterium]|nr:hypothetical protein [Francisellaceae bacterium]MBT6207566.1 hypothetical protein [Francisellaceae bacterium]MBT6538934.1 hypothetical protein [Francisellaceae bacterium]
MLTNLWQLSDVVLGSLSLPEEIDCWHYNVTTNHFENIKMSKQSLSKLSLKIEKQQMQISLLEDELNDINAALELEQSHCSNLESDLEHLIGLLKETKNDFFSSNNTISKVAFA